LLIFDEIQYANALVRTPNLPLLSYAEREIFKLYCLDIGLLSARAALHESVLFELDNKIFSHFRGALTEQFILQELKAMENLPVYYYASERGSAEVDFVIQKNNEIIPIEVKASINLKAKSLKTYMEDFKPQTAIRTSLANFSKNETLIDIPLYAFAEVISATILNEGHFHLIDGDSFENIS
jgi:predicted AAA+ superfamily ATPase